MSFNYNPNIGRVYSHKVYPDYKIKIIGNSPISYIVTGICEGIRDSITIGKIGDLLYVDSEYWNLIITTKDTRPEWF